MEDIDTARLKQAIRENHGPLTAYVRRRVPAGDVDDVVAEVFATAWACRADPASMSRRWLFAVARNRVHTLRKQQRRQAVIAEQLAAGLARSVDLGEGERAAFAAEVLDELPAPQRALLLLHHRDGVSTAELAAERGCSPTALRVQLYRARKAARTLARAKREDPA